MWEDSCSALVEKQYPSKTFFLRFMKSVGAAGESETKANINSLGAQTLARRSSYQSKRQRQTGVENKYLIQSVPLLNRLTEWLTGNITLSGPVTRSTHTRTRVVEHPIQSHMFVMSEIEVEPQSLSLYARSAVFSISFSLIIRSDIKWWW